MGINLVGPDLKKEATTALLPTALLVSQEGFESDGTKRMGFNSPSNGMVYYYPGNPDTNYTGTGILSGTNSVSGALNSLASSQTFNDQLNTQTSLGGGPSITQGPFNIFIGQLSGQAYGTVGSGGGNIGIGYAALQLNTSGSSNTAIGGIDCMSDNSTGSDNVALGTGALGSNTVGSKSVGIGMDTLAAYATSVGQNTAVGFAAMETASGDYNVAVGYYAGRDQNAGLGNVMLGWSAICHTAVNYSIVIGYGATSTFDNCINIGYNPATYTNHFAGSTIIGGVYTTDTLLCGNVQIAQTGASVYSLTTATNATLSSGIAGGNLILNGDTLKFANKRTIGSQFAGGYAGEICYDDSYVYVCIDTGNHWCRIPLTW
jgi:hypothetical protein